MVLDIDTDLDWIWITVQKHYGKFYDFMFLDLLSKVKKCACAQGEVMCLCLKNRL